MPSYQYIATQRDFQNYLREIEDADWIAYDTEFISEGRHLPYLCLLQAATSRGSVLIDAISVPDLTPFWERLCRPDTVSIAHASRHELEFCFRAINRFPAKIFDTQIAAAFVGYEYSISFKNLTYETLGISLDKSETRTDWSRRPLTQSQLDYAVRDVCDLKRMADVLTQKLDDLNRARWFVEESREFIETVKNALTDDDQWRKLLHGKKFTRDELAVIRELWRWRRERAVRTNAPEHRIFRDDAIIEIAKLRSADPARIASLRTVGFSDSSRVRDLSDVVANALALPAGEKPREHKTQNFPQYALASQALDMLLNQFAVSRRIAPKLLATVSDVREAIAARKGTFKGTPRLLRGWRAEMLGGYLDDWLAGRYTLKFSKNLESEPFQIIDAQPKK